MVMLASGISFVGRAQSINQRAAHIPGIYEGRLPCADCKELKTKLTLKCDPPCSSGTYKIEDRYNDSPEGKVIHKQAGTWHITDDSSPIELTIVLDKEKAGKESFYYLKKDGSLQPLDKQQRSIDNAPFDLTLQKTR